MGCLHLAHSGFRVLIPHRLYVIVSKACALRTVPDVCSDKLPILKWHISDVKVKLEL